MTSVLSPPQGRVLVSLGCVSHALGESEQALPYFRQPLALARERGERYLEAYVLTALGHCRGALGQLKEAKSAYQEALSLRWEMAQFNEATEAQAGLAVGATPCQSTPSGDSIQAS